MDTDDMLVSKDGRELMATARIDAQDESYILPLREYLEAHGVNVLVNGPPETQSLYHIVAGDATFVKDIFSRAIAHASKRLGIVLGGGKKQETFSRELKIVTASPTQLTPSEVLEIFEFFFTEGKNHLDLRPYPETRTVHEEVWIDEVPIAVQARVDDARVSSIIADVYKDDATPDLRHHKEKRHRRQKRVRAWILGVFMGIGLFVIPTFWYFMSMAIGGLTIASGARALRQGNVQAVVWDTRLADYWIHQGSFVLGAASIPLKWIGWEDNLRGQERLVSFLTDASQAENQTQSLTALAGRVAAGLLNQVNAASTGTTAASDISSLHVSLYTLGNTLGLAQAELQMLLADQTFPFSIHTISAKGREAVSDLSSIRESSADIDKLLSLFLSLAGFNAPRTYLVLLQNSMELRPTGGFIGSVAIASFADGRLTSLDIQDVYTYDGQLKGHVDPPLPIRNLLGQEHWYLRDSNWEPGFKEAGARAAWFYEKETGTTVDGVIAINTPFITDLLSATGPIQLTDYHDTITADNFYGKSMYYTQNDFFPGSTQKKDFLGSLSRAVLTTITSGKSANSAGLFRAITKALASHDLMMTFVNPDLQSLIEHYGWAGRVPPDIGCVGVDPSTCVFDPFISVEANLGVNKVNYFVTRSLDRIITVNPDGTRTESMTITFHNASGTQGEHLPYLVYDRFELPPDASVGAITLDDAIISTRSAVASPSAVPYIESTPVASGRFTVGVAFVVPPASDKRLTVTYTENQPLRFGPAGAVFDDFVAKQPGISGETAHTVIRYPSGWVAGIEETGRRSPTGFIAKLNQFEYNTILDVDAITRIRFTKP